MKNEVLKFESGIIVYLLKCADSTFFVGSTANLEYELARHFNREFADTAAKLPVNVHAYVAFRNKHKAAAFQRFLKTWPGRLFIRYLWA